MSQASSQAQFEALYSAESDRIFRFCLVRVSEREQALDLTQETFTRLWQSLQGGAVITNGRSFLFTIAHNLIIDWYRKKKSLSSDAMADPETGEPFEPVSETAHEDLQIAAEGRFLLEAINKLGPSYKLPVYLRFVEGLSPGEIGEVLGVTAGNASVRITRGLDELRRLTGYDVKDTKSQS